MPFANTIFSYSFTAKGRTHTKYKHYLINKFHIVPSPRAFGDVVNLKVFRQNIWYNFYQAHNTLHASRKNRYFQYVRPNHYLTWWNWIFLQDPTKVNQHKILLVTYFNMCAGGVCVCCVCCGEHIYLSWNTIQCRCVITGHKHCSWLGGCTHNTAIKIINSATYNFIS